MKYDTAVIIYPRVSNNASRILKQAKFLIDNNIYKRVIILSMFYDPKLEESVNVTDRINIKRIKTKTYNLPKNTWGDSIKFFEFFLRCIKIIGSAKPHIVIPHSLSVLPIGVFCKRFYKSRLIYDAHELETERAYLNGSRKRISKIMERKLIKYCDKICVVNYAIKDWYINSYGVKNIYSIPNYPVNPYLGKLAPKSTLLRDELNIPEEAIIFIYQGLLSKGRGTPVLLDIFKKEDIPKDRVIVFMGMGDMEEEVKEAANKYSRIYFKAAVSQEEIILYTSSADVGLLILFEDICLSYELSLPNKFMEYCVSGLFICINDKFKVMKDLLNKNHLGKVIASNNDAIITLIRSITKKEIQESYNLSKEYRKSIDWSQNNRVLLKVFN